MFEGVQYPNQVNLTLNLGEFYVLNSFLLCRQRLLCVSKTRRWHAYDNLHHQSSSWERIDESKHLTHVARAFYGQSILVLARQSQTSSIDCTVTGDVARTKGRVTSIFRFHFLIMRLTRRKIIRHHLHSDCLLFAASGIVCHLQAPNIEWHLDPVPILQVNRIDEWFREFVEFMKWICLHFQCVVPGDIRLAGFLVGEEGRRRNTSHVHQWIQRHFAVAWWQCCILIAGGTSECVQFREQRRIASKKPENANRRVRAESILNISFSFTRIG